MSVTQRQIAEKLNLSVATISRSLREGSDVTEKTRKQVLEMADRLGYRRPEGLHKAREEAKSRVRHLGVMMRLEEGSPNQQAIFSRMVFGASEVARREGVSLHTDCISMATEEAGRVDLPHNQPLALRDGLLEGIILVGHYPVEAVQRLTEQLPCVRVAAHTPGVPISTVEHDDQSACFELIRRLVKLEHKQIGFVGGCPEISFNKVRFAGYAESLRMLRLPIKSEWVLDFPSPSQESPESVLELVQQVMERIGQGVRAWFCTNDHFGYALAWGLHEHGVRIPQDVSICGFDDLQPPCGLPKLDSIAPPFESIGGTAVRMLLDQIDAPDRDPIRVLLPCKVVVGDSTHTLLQ